MVITNGLLYFVSHVPEFVATLLLIVFDRGISEFCRNYFSCVELIELTHFFNLLSISLQFFVFRRFDTNFRKSFAMIFIRQADSNATQHNQLE